MPVLKGGHEILDLVPGPREHVELEINCFLSPNYVLPGAAGTAAPKWCTSAIPLNKIPVAIQGSKLKIWECYKVKTGTTNWTTWLPLQLSSVFNGPMGSAWSVSGMPMSMLPVVNSTASDSQDSGAVAPLTNSTVPVALTQHYVKSIADLLYNPWVENAKYFMRASIGSTPMQFGDNNSTTVLLTDENGWGIMCPNQEVFLTSCDFATQADQTTSTNPFTVFQFPRYFKLYFRQRYVKSPVVLADIFQDYALSQVQGYTGETQNVMEVSMETDSRGNPGPEGMLNPTGVRNTLQTSGSSSANTANLFVRPEATSLLAKYGFPPGPVKKEENQNQTPPTPCSSPVLRGKK
ncbi:TPA: VP1 [Pomona leaf-nosed bat associated polyomavirus]|uniref:VP1 n=1 Tax=Pomona leaf-nosed bat associated polyomavirus TaxID=1885565 RepID=UPI000958D38D|nr:VP1 [Pomona leaf-nosed bat associated polyomavirus]SCC98884.1 TPA: VP1 [Pomona leaf-nosed bat associated polyomavirus]